jgi:hypothetical protein
MKFTIILLVLTPYFVSAASIFKSDKNRSQKIVEQINVPLGFERISVTKGSFANWLRQLPLNPPNSPVLDYKNRVKKSADDTTIAAVIDMNISGKNLDQCMDILMRMHAEYLISKNRKNKIIFPLPDGKMFSWDQWKEGYRFYFKGYNFRFHHIAEQDTSDNNFEHYLRAIFEYSGTQAFYHYYKSISFDSLQIGDFIVKKNPHGHAVMVIDIAQDKLGNKIALFGQGDTPACQFHILNYNKDNPWFPINKSQEYPPLPIKKSMKWDGLRRF